MAEICLQSSDPFDFITPGNRSHWQGCFEQFCIASGLEEASVSKQHIFLYCLSVEDELALTSNDITEGKQKDYALKLDKFDSFFLVHRNVTFERAQSNHQYQLPGESVKQYIVELYNMAKYCNYAN